MHVSIFYRFVIESLFVLISLKVSKDSINIIYLVILIIYYKFTL